MRSLMSKAALAALTLTVAFTVAACQKKAAAPAKPPPAPPREIEILTLAPAEARVTGEYLGSLLSRASLTVLPQVAGYIRKIHVKPGQTLAVGDPIVDVDAREENAALVSASAQAESAQASLALAEQSRARVEALHREGLATAQELDQRRADVAAAQAAVRAAGAQVSQRRVAVGNHVVRAAVPGVIGDVQARLGDYVTATTRLTTIAGDDALELTVSVPANRARGLAPGAPVELIADDGTVLSTSPAFFVSPDADPRTQLVAVKAGFPKGLGLRPSELVRARVVYSVGTAIQVPAMAVVRQSGQGFVYVVVEREGKLAVERRLVTLGALGPRGFIVEKGVAAGDRIAVSSIQMLRDGAPVTIKPPAPPPTKAASNVPAPAPAPATAGH
jgi:RND family efflux transporter MFP subunit